MADVIVQGLPAGRQPTGEFGWRFRAANGQITAVAGEGFTRRADARRAVKDFIHTAGRCADRFGDHDEPIVDVEEES